ncbi:MAG: hypothetical protein FJX75_18510 [Armatimonadetes bacterium]|nr:hypothetical protein [Armatimonadota bacterium]
MMRCPTEAELSRLYDGGMAAARGDELRLHLAECEPCRERLRSYERLEAALSGEAATAECLTAEELAELADGVADATTEARAATHAGQCEACREALEELHVTPHSVRVVDRRAARIDLRFVRAEAHPIRFLAAEPAAMATVSLVGVSAETHRRESRTIHLPVSARGELEGALEFVPGRAAVRCELEHCRAGGETRFGGTAYLRPGANAVIIGPPNTGPADNCEGFVHIVNDREYPNTLDLGAKVLATPNEYFGALLRALDKDRDLEREIDRFERTSINLFDNVRVYSPDRVYFEDDLDGYPAGTTEVPGLVNVWGGRIGIVAAADEFSFSPPNVWLSEAYPNSNRCDGIPLTPRDVPSGRLTFEAAVYVSDPAKGALVGLIHKHAVPPDLDEIYASEPALVCFRDGWVYLSRASLRPSEPLPKGFVGLARFEAKTWYTLRVDVDLAAHHLAIRINGDLIGRGLRMAMDMGPHGYDFNHFTLSGANFVLQQQAARG